MNSFLSLLLSANLFAAPISLDAEHAVSSFSPFPMTFTLDQSELKKAPLAEKQYIKSSDLCNINVFDDLTEKEKEVIAAALKDLPCALVKHLRKLNVFDNPARPRALAGATSLHLRSDFFDLPEAKNVLIHEFAHIIDLGGVRPWNFVAQSEFVDGNVPIYTSDPSVAFYRISWTDNETWTRQTSKADFVSRYGATDPFEDFAESLLYYVEHGNAFRALAANNDRLQAKYDFLSQYIFDGEEFRTGTVPTNLASRVWDATKL